MQLGETTEIRGGIGHTLLLSLPTTLKRLELKIFPIEPFRSGWLQRLTNLQVLAMRIPKVVEPDDFQALPNTIRTLKIYHLLDRSSLSNKKKQIKFPGKEAWIAAMSHFHIGFSELTIDGFFCDPNILYGLKKDTSVPLRVLVLRGIQEAHPLADEHLASTNLKFLNVIRIGGASICTVRSLSCFPRGQLRGIQLPTFLPQGADLGEH